MAEITGRVGKKNNVFGMKGMSLDARAESLTSQLKAVNLPLPLWFRMASAIREHAEFQVQRNRTLWERPMECGEGRLAR